MTAQVTNSQADSATPAPEPLLRWSDNGCNSGILGHAGNVGDWLFQIWRPSTGVKWELIACIPDKTTAESWNQDELKERAERWLRWFIDDLTSEPITSEKPASS